MKVKDEVVTKIYIVISCIYAFFSHIKYFSFINVNKAYLLISILFTLYKIIIKNQIIKIRKYECILILFLVYLIISNYYLSFTSNGIEYFLFFFAVSINSILLKDELNWSNYFINIIFVCCITHCFFIMMQAIFPSIFNFFSKLLLSDSVILSITYARGNNYYSGITLGPASAGLFSTILIGILLSKMLIQKKYNLKNIILLLLGILSLVLSQKRAFILAVIVATIFIIFVNEKSKKTGLKFINKMFAFSVIIFFICLILSFIPQTQNVINRFVNNDRMLSGREVMYEQMFNWFLKNKFIGIGLGMAKTTFGYGGHNVYLQMLAECGIIGSILYFGYMLYLMIYNYKIAIESIDYRTLFAIFIQIILLVYSLTGNPIYDYTYLMLFMYILSIPCSIKERKK